jgi:prevent-host-death family protein
MKVYTVSEARERFAEMVQAVEQGDEVAITRHGRAIAKVTRVLEQKIPAPGWAAREGWTITVAEDFDTIPANFEEYT